MINPETVMIFIYTVLSPYTNYVAAFFFGFSLLVATAVLVVKTLSFKQ